jgi:hypothetical protein
MTPVAGTISVGRRQYAVGLYWQISPSGKVAQAAREAARQPGLHADFFAIRGGTKNGRVAQYGLGQLEFGHKAGMPSAAASLASGQPGSWAGAFKLREGFWVVVVRDDLITSEGDQFYAEEADARERLMQEIALGGLQRVYAPEGWSVPGADPIPLSLLLERRSDGALRNVTTPRSTLIGIGAFVVLLLVGTIYLFYWQQQQREAEEAELRRVRADAIERAKREAQMASPIGSSAPVYTPPPRVWENQPTVTAWLDACRDALTQVSGAVLGWKPSHISCDGKALSVQWQRDKGYALMPAGLSVDVTGMQAVQVVTLPNLNRRGPENLLSPDEITKKALAENWPGRLKRLEDDPRPPVKEGEPPPPPPPWVKRGYSYSSDTAPWTEIHIFNRVPGFIMKSLDWNGKHWSAEGEIYENRNR